ncbi:hypothetical protein BMS3Abin02_00802 [bacterium BMS3Abin02]|nr:hypothetical protein BMS3Abin02_00802 [bacterium BMS3Abin02]GBE23307.1 hypothetical protein BMS3Bbin01_02691 [bacterium BMS3Bbin01]
MKRFAVFVTLALLVAACGGTSTTTTTAATTATAAGTARSLDLTGVAMEIHVPPG